MSERSLDAGLRVDHGAHISPPLGACPRCARMRVSSVLALANAFVMSDATALNRTGAMALACGGQVTTMTGGVPAGLSSSMMISEPFTRALARVVDSDKAGFFSGLGPVAEVTSPGGAD